MTNGSGTVGADLGDTHCVVAYRRLRAGVSTKHQIGYGRNMYPASPALVEQIRHIVSVLFEQQRMTDYSTGFDGSDRNLISRLLACWFGREDIEPDDVFVMSGSTEAISVVTRYLAMKNYAYILPLPCYYAFEQSARRWGVDVAGYYNSEGVRDRSPAGSKLALVDIVPNGVTGRRFKLPSGGQGCFKIVDSVFQVSAESSLGREANDRHLRTTAREVDLATGCIMLTASKDLSIPGLRAGLLVTKDSGLKRYIAADRFERCYSLSPLSTSIVALYVALMCARASVATCLTGDARATSILVPPDIRLGVSIPDPLVEMLWHSPIIDQLNKHVQAMARHYGGVLDIFREWCERREIDFHSACPETGYSLFLPLPVQVQGSEAALGWCNRVGRELGLKLNPAAIFGGHDEPWSALYDCSKPWIRFNCSVGQRDARDTLRILDEALR